MKKDIAENKAPDNRKFVKAVRELGAYTLVGIENFFVQYGSYYFLLKLGVYYEIANVIAYLIVTVNSYIMYTLFVFKPDAVQNDGAGGERPKRKRGVEDVKRFVRLMIVNISYMILNALLIVFFVETVKMPEETALLACIAVLTPYSFLLTKFWAYKK